MTSVAEKRTYPTLLLTLPVPLPRPRPLTPPLPLLLALPLTLPVPLPVPLPLYYNISCLKVAMNYLKAPFSAKKRTSHPC